MLRAVWDFFGEFSSPEIETANIVRPQGHIREKVTRLLVGILRWIDLPFSTLALISAT